MLGLSKYIVAALIAAHEVKIAETSTLTQPQAAGGCKPVLVALIKVVKSVAAPPCTA